MTEDHESSNEEQGYIAVFKEEAYERLAELESALLSLESRPEDHDLIDSAFRAMHTIKGSGGMFGFDEIVAFTHTIETVFDKVRDGTILVTEDLIELTLAAHDQIGKMLSHFHHPKHEDIEKRKKITKQFLQYLPLQKAPEDNTTQLKPMDRKQDSLSRSVYRIRFKPASNLFATGTNPILLLNEVRELGDCNIVAHVDSIVGLEEIDPEKCYTWWDIILSTCETQNAIEDVFIFVDDTCEIKIELIESDSVFDINESHRRLGEILVDKGDIEAGELQRVLNSKTLLGKQLQDEGLIQSSFITSALAEQKLVQEAKENRRKIESISSIRVSSDKLDKLVDLVGELVTAQARLSQIAATKHDSSVQSIAEEVERLTSELRDSTMSVRMLSFGTTFNKFKRLVRDLSAELEKDINLVTAGEDTELDKKVIEQLNDPLVHLIRNAADHGIESMRQRIATGKQKSGTIKLSASYSGAQVLITIEDDGAGMDPVKIQKKAIEKGLIAKDTTLSEKDCFFLILEPGFSTSLEVTNVSGRGVGMDVVKRAIDDLRGTIDIDSKLGGGTRITLKLPLTLAIIDGLLVHVGEEYFVIPLAFVEECIELTQVDIEKSHGRQITDVRGHVVPYIRLKDQFKINGKGSPIEQVVITEIEGHRIGFVVDGVIGQHQTVIKHLSKVYKNVDVISGATIMADGTVALIIDINKCLQLIEKRSHDKTLAERMTVST